MLTSDQERALERFSLQCDGRSVQVKEYGAVAVFTCGRRRVFVEKDGAVHVYREMTS